MGTTESLLSHGGAPPPSHPQQPSASRQRQQHPSPSGGSIPHRPVRRPRPGPVVTLNGLVLGLTGSGKRTLLQRLEGKDPFAHVDSNNNAVDNDDPPRDITVPYQPPSNATIWDRIQLHVELKPDGLPADFCVVLVNPRHDARNLRPYIAKLVSMLIKQSKGGDKPLCLCFLLNFRDLQGDRYNRIQCDQVQEWVQDVLQQHNIPDDQVIVQCTTTSLKNCYGLSTLHHFIYRCYLVHKEVELKQRLDQVQSARKKSEEVPSMTYEAFLKVLAQTNAAAALSNEKQQADKSSRESGGPSAEKNKETRERGRERRKSQSDGDGERKQAGVVAGMRISQVSDKEKEQNGLGTSRSILPKTYGDPQKTLDAFFADDDDEEENIVTPVTSHHARNRVLHTSSDSDDDDEEDDDFFYDEGGHRHQHGTVVMSDSSSDQDDEGTVESLDSQIAHARDHSILDSEDSGIDESVEGEIGGVSAPVRSNEQPIDAARASDGDERVDDTVESGWDDDDIDLDGDIVDDVDAEEKPADTKEKHPQESKEAKGSSNDEGEGWGDEDDLDFDGDDELETHVAVSEKDKPPYKDANATSDETESSPVSTEQPAANGNNSELSPRELDVPTESQGKETGTTEGSNDAGRPSVPQESSSVGSETSDAAIKGAIGAESKVVKVLESPETSVAKKPASPPDKDESSDKDGVIAEEATASTLPLTLDTEPIRSEASADKGAPPELTETSIAEKPTSHRTEDESSDEDDFIVESTASSTLLPKTRKPQPESSKAATAKEQPSPKPEPPSTASSGISAAALAAIAAAEKEAALMVQEQQSMDERPSRTKLEKKKSKKKKDPEAKKKKKKHKESKRSASRESSVAS